MAPTNGGQLAPQVESYDPPISACGPLDTRGDVSYSEAYQISQKLSVGVHELVGSMRKCRSCIEDSFVNAKLTMARQVVATRFVPPSCARHPHTLHTSLSNLHAVLILSWKFVMACETPCSKHNVQCTMHHVPCTTHDALGIIRRHVMISSCTRQHEKSSYTIIFPYVMYHSVHHTVHIIHHSSHSKKNHSAVT